MSPDQWILVGALSAATGALAFMAARRTPRSKPVRGVAQPHAADTPSTADALPSLARIHDDDLEDDGDATRVGAGAGWGPRQRTVYQPPVTPVVYDEDADLAEPPDASALLLVHATAQTDVGLRRKRNEDSLLVEDAENLFAIADGMGGYRGGELASQLAVRAIAGAFRAAAFEGPAHQGIPQDATNLARAIQMANAGILELVGRKPELEGMGTTVCAARFSPKKQRLYVGHVGDSRCYRWRDGELAQMTADHTMADLGVAGPESTHLSRAVGVWPTVPIDIVMAVPRPGDAYLLCSDGLTKMLSDGDIADALRATGDAKVTVERLVSLANANGGKDNITVILVQVLDARAAAKRGR
ncbi:MAG TPA: protein phosphatase 2C domain-containing protein [Labilithrix sp.]|nr:protein phosphatase 2C domain-containing protein [Labilithrix sp.]